VISVFGMALGAAGLVAQRAILRISSDLGDLRRIVDAHEDAVVQPYDDTELRSMLDTLTQAVGSGIKEVDRNNKRIEAVVRRARAELEDVGLEHAGLEAANSEIQPVDGTGSDEQQVLDLPPIMEAPRGYDPPSGVPGFTVSELKTWRERLTG